MEHNKFDQTNKCKVNTAREYSHESFIYPKLGELHKVQYISLSICDDRMNTTLSIDGEVLSKCIENLCNENEGIVEDIQKGLDYFYQRNKKCVANEDIEFYEQ